MLDDIKCDIIYNTKMREWVEEHIEVLEDGENKL